jgi:hypothetical protein
MRGRGVVLKFSLKDRREAGVKSSLKDSDRIWFEIQSQGQERSRSEIQSQGHTGEAAEIHSQVHRKASMKFIHKHSTTLRFRQISITEFEPLRDSACSVMLAIQPKEMRSSNS